MRFTTEKKKIIAVLFLMITLGQFGIDLYLPSIPLIASNLNSTLSTIQLTIPLYLLGFGISQLFYGPMGDVLGRKPVLYFGLSVFLLGSLGCLFSNHALLILFFRTIQGLGIGAAIVKVRAIVRDAFQGKQMARVSAWLVIVWSVTPIVAPVLGGYIQSYLGWRANFAAMFLYALLTGFLIILFLPETLDKHKRIKSTLISTARVYKKIFFDRTFICFSLMSSLCFSYFISYATVSPSLFQIELGLTPVTYGWMLFIIACGAAGGSHFVSFAFSSR